MCSHRISGTFAQSTPVCPGPEWDTMGGFLVNMGSETEISERGSHHDLKCLERSLLTSTGTDLMCRGGLMLCFAMLNLSVLGLDALG